MDPSVLGNSLERQHLPLRPTEKKKVFCFLVQKSLRATNQPYTLKKYKLEGLPRNKALPHLLQLVMAVLFISSLTHVPSWRCGSWCCAACCRAWP